VIQLRAEFEKNTDSSRTPITVAKMALNAAKEMGVPYPFDCLVIAALALVQLVENAVEYKSECARLADRIARINLLVRELTTAEGSTDAVLKCAQDLTAVINRAVTLLEECRDNDRSWTKLGWTQRVKVTCKKVVASTADKFTEIYKELDPIISDTNLAVTLQLQRCTGPQQRRHHDQQQQHHAPGPVARPSRHRAPARPDEILQYVQRFQDDIVPRCPHCDCPFDYDECIAIENAACCGGSFCAICVVRATPDCDGHHDAHMFVARPLYERMLKKKQEQALARFIQDSVPRQLRRPFAQRVRCVLALDPPVAYL
jgi:hypothetical protein